MKHFTLALCLLIFSLSSHSQSISNLNVPIDHPRLFWDSTSLFIAKNWYSSNTFSMPSTPQNLTVYEGDDAMDFALKYVLSEGITDSTTRYGYARNAIEWAKLAIIEMQSAPYNQSTNGGTCNECRWYAEGVMLILDWCYPALTTAEWNDIYNDLNQLIPMWNGASWGNATMVTNNFNHGYARQSILWALMIYHENNQLAISLLQDAINTRWANYLNYVASKGVGGIPSEGTSYAYAQLSYHLVAGKSMENAGYDYLGQTDFFKKAIAHTIYNTTPNPSYIGPNETNKYVLPYPYGDAGVFMSIDPWNEPLEGAHANFMLMMAYKYQGIGDLPLYAKDWVVTHDRYSVFNGVPRYIRAVTDHLPIKSITNNPLDYFSPDGGGELPYGYARSSWIDTTASSVFVQMGKPPYGGHEHQDAGSYTIAKGDRFLVIPPSGRGYGSGWKIPDYDGLPANGEDVQRTIAKNSLLFGKEGSAFYGESHGGIDRLQSDPNFFFVANDLTETYKNPNNPNDPNSNNEHCESFVRELVYIRPLETTLVFDRTKSVATEDLTKTSLVHVQNQPVLSATDEYTLQNGGYEAVIHTLLPANKTIQVIDERTVTGETPREDEAFRLQIENSDAGTVYFLNVIQAKVLQDAKVGVSLLDTANFYTVVLTHPTVCDYVVQFEKGQFSQGGSIGCLSGPGPYTLDPFNENAQGITVTDDGPLWSTFPASLDDYFSTPNESCELKIFEANDRLYVNTEEFQGVQMDFSIHDIMGRTLLFHSMPAVEKQTQLDLNTLKSKGVYFIHYNSSECAGTIKFLKE